MYVRNLRERYGKIRLKKKVENKHAQTKVNSQKKQCKRFQDEPNALHELPLGESCRISHFPPTIVSLIPVLSQKIAVYSGLRKKIGFIVKLNLGEILVES